LQLRYFRAARNYVLIALAVAVFGAVYEHFSFGVYSYYMIYAFAVPLVCGALPALLLPFCKRVPAINEFAKKLWRDGIAVWTVGSLFTGVIQIYGTDSVWSKAYAIAGLALFAASGIAALLRETGA
jgi:hypothetical protein